MSGRVEIVTFGCRLNAYESEAMREAAQLSEHEHMVIVNTCAVTGEAERQARQAIRKLRRENPGATIIVTGCAAQTNHEVFAAMPEVDRVLGNRSKLDPLILLGSEKLVLDDMREIREQAGHLLSGFEGRARAFVQIQQGCDRDCTFCVIPSARGPSISLPAGRIVEEIGGLVTRGWKEIVLTGVDIASWGSDLLGSPTLGGLVRRLLSLVADLPRLRLSSLDPAACDDELLTVLANEQRLLPHLHLSIQSGGDMTLKRMKRRHSREDVLSLVARVRAIRPDIALGADLIAGFPTESEEDFAATLSLIEECGLSHIHVFPYSARKGTSAARMPQLPMSVRKERAACLRAAGDKVMRKLMESLIGGEVEVLVERDNRGHCRHFLPVQLVGEYEPGTIVKANVQEINEGVLIAK
jgi:threonylcarbamoyladenosine tRNA methylthiotransferase MtaB